MKLVSSVLEHCDGFPNFEGVPIGLEVFDYGGTLHDVRRDALLILAVSLILVEEVTEKDKVLYPVSNTVLRDNTIRTQVAIMILFDWNRDLLRSSLGLDAWDFIQFTSILSFCCLRCLLIFHSGGSCVVFQRLIVEV